LNLLKNLVSAFFSVKNFFDTFFSPVQHRTKTTSAEIEFLSRQALSSGCRLFLVASKSLVKQPVTGSTP
jgi:hypothetical protein